MSSIIQYGQIYISSHFIIQVVCIGRAPIDIMKQLNIRTTTLNNFVGETGDTKFNTCKHVFGRP